MKHVQPSIASHSRALSRAAVAVALAIASSSQAAPTDISNNPIASSTSAAVKPNIMLLMDASGSMARTHMPDELETTAGPTSIGYKSSQCNVLYYNPAQVYTLPKRFDGTFFPAPAFGAAPYAGFGAYYAVADLSTTDLNSKFVAYDNNTLDVVSPFPDTAQRAYYYVYTGAQTLKFDTQPCNQHDTGVTVAATGGGTWTKTFPTTAAELQNFAVWYSFYRTRISLIKSAASLAFSPLNDTKRVGFITVEPKDTPAAAAINPIRYLPVNDFDAAQKNLWFNKLFSQKPKGASPAREGLARVGRYYAGLEDSINTGMAATGPNDPLQYACQQNFTIMTTDGYWNGQSETPAGGGVKLDGTTLVGQQDGDLSDPYSQPPMWDGTSSTTRVVTNKVNAYSDNVCSLAGKYRSTYQMQKEIDLVTKDTTRTVRETIQYTSASRQDVATTTQTTKVVTQTTQNTMQYLLTKHQPTIEQYQIVISQDQTTKVTQQYQLQTSQTAAQTFQTSRVQTQIWETDEQWMTAKSQFVAATTQYVLKKDQYRMGRVQVIEHQYQTIAYDHSDEHGDAIPGLCVASPGNYPIECRQTEVLMPQFVDPASCVQDLAGSAPSYVKTTCTPGASSQAYGPIGTCVPGVSNSGAPNFIVTTCDLVNIDAPAAFNGSCVAGTSQTGAPDYFLFTCSQPAGNNTSTPVASCAVGSSSSGAPNWITTSCSQPVGPNNQPPTASLPCAVGSATNGAFVTTTCTKPTDTAGFVAACVPDLGAAPPYLKRTCTPSTLGNSPIDSASCTAGVSGAPGFIVTSCPKVPAGPFAAVTPVAACVNGASSGPPNFYETACTNPAATNKTVFTTAAACGPIGVTPPSAPLWITSDCEKPPGVNNQTTFSDPALCIADPGTAFPYLKVTCTTAVTLAATPVDPATCPLGNSVGAGPGFVVTHCVKQAASLPASTCPSPLPPAAPDWIVTVCGDAFVYEPVAFCVVGPVAPVPPYDSIICSQNPTTSFVATCTPSAAVAPNFIEVTCAGPVTLFNAPVDPATCVAGTSAPPNVQVTTCTPAPIGPYAVATPVPACVAGMDASFVVTTCSNPPATNHPPQPSAPCAVGSSTDGSQITTTCAMSDLVEYVPTAVCVNLAQAGNGPSVTCTTTPTLGTLAGVCAVGAVDGAPFFDTITNCTTTIVSPMANAPSCTAGPGPGPGQATLCHEVPVDVLVADAGCAVGTDASGLRTACTTLFGAGHQYAVTETDTTTTTPYSGAVATGPGVTVTTVKPTVDVDGVCYPGPQLFTAQPPVTIAGCAAWPCTVDTTGPATSENSLADVAQYYYKNNLRPLAPLADQNRVPPVDVTDAEADNATHQHMTTFVVALGVSGTLNFRPDYRSHLTVAGDFADIRTTVKRWPQWPDPALDYTNSDNYNNKKAIDDYWHTAVNGRGLYFSADNPTSVINGLGDALFGTDGSLGSGAADAVSTLQPVAGNNFVYTTTYAPGPWYGDISALQVDPSTGIVSGNPGNAGLPYWSAKNLLEGKVTDFCDDRKIYVIHNGTTLSDFTWNTKKCAGAVGPGAPAPDGLDATEQSYFSPLNVSLLSQFPFMTDGTGATPAQQQEAQLPGKLVNYLRGQRGNEGFSVGSLTNLYRKRKFVLGDIIDSQAVYVQAPFADYAENGYPGFKSGQSGRTPMLYVGANDGMLHAFYATEDLTNPLAGTEAWAVIPSAVLPNMYKLADSSYARGQHEFLVDGTPVVGDAFIGGSWKTILVGGLNAGGKGYYALDVTNAGALPTPLWEFKQNTGTCPASSAAAVGNTSDCNLGLSFGKPVITKLAGNWVVMVTSGYNNNNGAGNGLDGIGFLYVLNARTGAIIHKIATTAGTAATPSGLAQINNFTDNGQVDNSTLHVYGGDVLGNMWRFDFLPGPSATLLGTAKDTANVIEPITVRPELAELNGKPFVMFGTGRLLGTSDVTDNQKQSVYGFTDPLSGAGPIYPDPIRNSLRPMAISSAVAAAGATRTTSCSGNAAQCGLPAGWVLDLDEPGERVNVEMHLVLGALVFTSNVPRLIPCDVGGHAWFNQVDFRTGGPVSSTDPTVISSQYLSDAINVGFNTIQLVPPPGRFNPRLVGSTNDSRGRHGLFDINPPPPPPQGRRTTWREVSQ
jgi:Tfp pilus tip-associated adhesin PilY1